VAAIGGRAQQVVCGRLFAAAYEWLLRGSERAGLADRRRDLLTRARGATVEIGAGTGLNIAYYPDTVTELVLTEPSPYMARRLRTRAAQRERATRVVDAVGEKLPFPDASMDTVVATLVLCTVVDLAKTLSEIARILRPDGQLLFLEHVRSGDPRLCRAAGSLATTVATVRPRLPLQSGHRTCHRRRALHHRTHHLRADAQGAEDRSAAYRWGRPSPSRSRNWLVSHE
jgi:SAM-dependent methyltransferase